MTATTMPATAQKTIGQLRKEAVDLAMKANEIFEKGDDATPEERATAQTYVESAEKIEADLVDSGREEAVKTANRIANTFGAIVPAQRPPLGGAEHLPGGDGIGTGRNGNIHSTAIKTAGEQFVNDPAFNAWLKTVVAENGRIPSKSNLNSPPIEVKALYTTTGDIAASRPMLGQPDRRAEVVMLGWTPRMLRSLVSNLTTNSDTVEVVRELSRTNNAALVAEATDVSDGTGEKPQSELAWELITVAVQTIAHWVATSTRVLQDARRLRGEIDAFLREGIEQEVERQILVGAGSGSNEFTGVRNTTGILTQAFSSSILTTTRKARTNLKLNGRVNPTAFVMNPADWETIDLLVDNETRYYFGGPMQMGTPRLWGVPVIESEYETSGYAILGYWPDAVIYDREQTSINVSNSHADFFIRNLLAILGEARLAFHVRRPKSFVDVDLVA